MYLFELELLPYHTQYFIFANDRLEAHQKANNFVIKSRLEKEECRVVRAFELQIPNCHKEAKQVQQISLEMNGIRWTVQTCSRQRRLQKFVHQLLHLLTWHLQLQARPQTQDEFENENPICHDDKCPMKFPHRHWNL